MSDPFPCTHDDASRRERLTPQTQKPSKKEKKQSDLAVQIAKDTHQQGKPRPAEKEEKRDGAKNGPRK